MSTVIPGVPDGPTPEEARVLRGAVALTVGVVTAIVVFAMAAGISGSGRGGAIVGVLAAAVVAVALWRRPPVPYAGEVPRALALVSGAVTLVALVEIARLTVFMVSPAQVGYSQFPFSKFEVQHACVTAYFMAGQVISATPNVYDDDLYSLPGDPAMPRRPRMLGPFRIDNYEYPPPFLLLPRALGLLAPDFPRFRLAWFGLNLGVAFLATLLMARALGPEAGTRALLLAPFLWAAIPILNGLQKGNVQVLVIAISMIAMALLERRRDAAGGLLLAYATLSKLYPGMLLVYLLVRRQWRALAWTAAWSAVLLLVSVVDTGLAPYKAFLDHLPGLLGGEAFAAFRSPGATAINVSVPGIVFKLKLFGIAGGSFGAAKIVGWIYTLAVVAAVVFVARRGVRASDAPGVWLAILILATLRSPFLPQGYGSFTAVWLLTLLAATRLPTAKVVVPSLLAWLALNLFVPQDLGVQPAPLALIVVVPQLAVALVAVAALRRVTATELPA
jgi:alpha-1,2-mannosyltransferase